MGLATRIKLDHGSSLEPLLKFSLHDLNYFHHPRAIWSILLDLSNHLVIDISLITAAGWTVYTEKYKAQGPDV